MSSKPTRKCKQCKTAKSEDDFYKQKGGDGIELVCKPCKSKNVVAKRKQKKAEKKEEKPKAQKQTEVKQQMEWYKEQLLTVEMDLENCRAKGIYSALGPLYTKAQQFRDMYDELAKTKDKEEKVYEDMPDELLVNEIASMIKKLPLSVRTQVIKELNGK